MKDCKTNIILVSKNLFSYKSYPEVSVKDIMDETNFSRQDFYFYFKDKYDLFFLISKDFIRSFRLISNNVTNDKYISLIISGYYFWHKIKSDNRALSLMRNICRYIDLNKTMAELYAITFKPDEQEIEEFLTENSIGFISLAGTLINLIIHFDTLENKDEYQLSEDMFRIACRLFEKDKDLCNFAIREARRLSTELDLSDIPNWWDIDTLE